MRPIVLILFLLLGACTSEVSTQTPDSPDSGADAGQGDIEPFDMPTEGDMTEVEDAGADSLQDTDMPDMPQEPQPRAIGPRPVDPTPLAQGTIFAAPDGSGQDCTQETPCDVWEALEQAEAGDVVFLRGGEYAIDRNLNFRGRGATPRAIFESYPGEEAILDGSALGPDDDIYIRVLGDPVTIRLLTIRNMPKGGISVRTSDNLLEGLKIHDNLLSGIHIHESYETPVSNRNIIRDSVIWGNSGAGLMTAEYADGGNSDGISISSGIGNRVENCLVYGNSDDGIDVWRSTDAYVGYSIIHSSGIASGNGQGVKAGGAPPSARAFVEHNISYNNKSAGFDFNSGVGVTFRQNTSWGNSRGFWFGDDTLSELNLAFEDATHGGGGQQNQNSWQFDGTPTPLNTDPASSDFLLPAEPAYSTLGAHAGRTVE